MCWRPRLFGGNVDRTSVDVSASKWQNGMASEAGAVAALGIWHGGANKFVPPSQGGSPFLCRLIRTPMPKCLFTLPAAPMATISFIPNSRNVTSWQPLIHTGSSCAFQSTARAQFRAACFESRYAPCLTFGGAALSNLPLPVPPPLGSRLRSCQRRTLVGDVI